LVQPPFGSVQMPQLSLQQTIPVAQWVEPQTGPPGRQVPKQTAGHVIDGEQPGGGLQTPSSVVHTSPWAQLLEDVHGAPPEPPAPPDPPAPPAPVGSSGQVIIQTPWPFALIVQIGTVRPTAQPIAGIGMPTHGPPSTLPLPP
jgi:hypothetical protein